MRLEYFNPWIWRIVGVSENGTRAPFVLGGEEEMGLRWMWSTVNLLFVYRFEQRIEKPNGLRSRTASDRRC